MANEVRIKLTDEQKAKIKEATGKDMPEIRVGSLGDNPAVSAEDGDPRARRRARHAARAGRSRERPALRRRALRRRVRETARAQTARAKSARAKRSAPRPPAPRRLGAETARAKTSPCATARAETAVRNARAERPAPRRPALRRLAPRSLARETSRAEPARSQTARSQTSRSPSESALALRRELLRRSYEPRRCGALLLAKAPTRLSDAVSTRRPSGASAQNHAPRSRADEARGRDLRPVPPSRAAACRRRCRRPATRDEPVGPRRRGAVGSSRTPPSRAASSVAAEIRDDRAVCRAQRAPRRTIAGRPRRSSTSSRRRSETGRSARSVPAVARPRRAAFRTDVPSLRGPASRGVRTAPAIGLAHERGGPRAPVARERRRRRRPPRRSAAKTSAGRSPPRARWPRFVEVSRSLGRERAALARAAGLSRRKTGWPARDDVALAARAPRRRSRPPAPRARDARAAAARRRRGPSGASRARGGADARTTAAAIRGLRLRGDMRSSFLSR